MAKTEHTIADNKEGDISTELQTLDGSIDLHSFADLESINFEARQKQARLIWVPTPNYQLMFASNKSRIFEKDESGKLRYAEKTNLDRSLAKAEVLFENVRWFLVTPQDQEIPRDSDTSLDYFMLHCWHKLHMSFHFMGGMGVEIKAEKVKLLITDLEVQSGG